MRTAVITVWMGRIDCMGGIGVWEWGWDATGGC